MSATWTKTTCCATARERNELHVRTILSFLADYKPFIDAYITDFFVHNHWNSVPPAWQGVLAKLEPPEVASLLNLQTWTTRRVWPLSLLSYRVAAHSLAFQRQPPVSCANSDNSKASKSDDVNAGPSGDGATAIQDGQLLKLEHCYRRHVKPKKQHEILKLGENLHKLCQDAQCKQIVDVGAGQGHLSRLLTFGYGLKVTTIEASGHHVPRAQKFDSEVMTDIEKGRIETRKKRKSRTPCVSGSEPGSIPVVPNHVVGMIDPDISVEAFLQKLKLCQNPENDGTEVPLTRTCETNDISPSSHATAEACCSEERVHNCCSQACPTVSGVSPSRAPPSKPQDGEPLLPFALTGLHACGDLTPTILRVFAKCPQAVAVGSVACCYMKMTTDSTVVETDQAPGYPMSQYVQQLANHELSYEAREMACHFIDAYHQRLLDNPPDLMIHGYRAALQTILLQKDPNIAHGSDIKLNVKKGHTLPFKRYAETALQKLGLDPTLTETQLEQAAARLRDWQKVVAFFTLRLALAPAIETAILLDRWIFLQEQDIECDVMPIFDPRLSPRNFLLVARKH